MKTLISIAVCALCAGVLNADPLFSPKVDYAAGDGPHSVFSIDYDGDGNNDLATAN